MANPDFTPEELASEEWRPIAANTDYQVSNLGRARSLAATRGKRKTPKILKASPKQGYPTIGIRINGIYKQRTVHKLVLETFVGPCPPDLEACHDDGIRSNCRVSNLRWDTRQANAKDAVRHGSSPIFKALSVKWADHVKA